MVCITLCCSHCNLLEIFVFVCIFVGFVICIFIIIPLSINFVHNSSKKCKASEQKQEIKQKLFSQHSEQFKMSLIYELYGLVSWVFVWFLIFLNSVHFIVTIWRQYISKYTVRSFGGWLWGWLKWLYLTSLGIDGNPWAVWLDYLGLELPW